MKYVGNFKEGVRSGHGKLYKKIGEQWEITEDGIYIEDKY